MKSYDVIIVGAGPSGATAAYYLANAGMKVLILEKYKLPRFKACGGGIFEKVLASLPFDTSSAITGRTTNITFYNNLKDPVHAKLDTPIIMLNRKKFDYLITEAAVRHGAELNDEIRVNNIEINQNNLTVSSNKGSFLTRFLIGADGAHSFIGKRTGIVKRRGIWTSLEAEVQGLKQNLETSFVGFGHLKTGYTWSFAKKDYYSVGIGGIGGKKLTVEFRRWLDFLGCKDNPRIVSHPIPQVVVGEKLQKGNILVVGDAAGLVDPLTGEGIRHAIKSAQIASEVIIENKIDEYSRRILKNISYDFKFSYWISWFFYNFQGFCHQKVIKNNRESLAFSKILSGKSVYQKLLKNIINPLKNTSFR